MFLLTQTQTETDRDTPPADTDTGTNRNTPLMQTQQTETETDLMQAQSILGVELLVERAEELLVLLAVPHLFPHRR